MMQRLTRMRTRKMMVSRITGKMQIYDLVRHMDTCSRFTADMNELKSGIQAEFDVAGLDAIMDSCRQIREPTFDYLLTDVWEPATSPIDPATITAIIVILKWVIPIIIAGITFYAVQKAVHDTWFPPTKFYCDICGAEFSSVTELTAHRRIQHPEAAPYQCPYCGSAFNTAGELTAHMEECPLKPKDDWLKWVLIIACVVVGGVLVFKFLPVMLKPVPKK